MCDYDGNAKVVTETVRKAAKQHRCYGCDEAIRPGDRYQYTSGIWEEPDSFKHCLRCAAMLDALPNGAIYSLDCGETWIEPPEHIAALAFWLPGDPVPEQRPEHGWGKYPDGLLRRVFADGIVATIEEKPSRFEWIVWIVRDSGYALHASGFVRTSIWRIVPEPCCFTHAEAKSYAMQLAEDAAASVPGRAAEQAEAASEPTPETPG